MTVDVLVPTYKSNPAHLSAALQSLVQQTYKDWQAFVHDDPTDADVASIVAPFLGDKRIRFARSPHRLGIGGNWNACVKNTGNPYVAFLFQDDVWGENYLAAAVDVLSKNPTVGFVSMEHSYKIEGGMENVHEHYDNVHNFILQNVKEGQHNGREFLRWWVEKGLSPNVIGEPSFVVMRRSVMDKAGPFLEDMPQFLDSEYWLRLLLISDWYAERSNTYGYFRVHATAASAQNQESGAGLADRLRCFEYLIAALKGGERKHVKKARNNALQSMIDKFFTRISSGKKVGGKGGGSILQFALKHPLLMTGALLRYVKESLQQ